jgi:hypothetical protein
MKLNIFETYAHVLCIVQQFEFQFTNINEVKQFEEGLFG